jgi:membrane protein GlpM
VRWPLAVTLGVATAVWVLMALGMIVLSGRLHPSVAGA